MPWKVREVMSLRREFVRLATQPGSNTRELCRRFGISPRTGYKWLKRFAEQWDAGLRNRPRRSTGPDARSSRTPRAVDTAGHS